MGAISLGVYLNRGHIYMAAMYAWDILSNAIYHDMTYGYIGAIFKWGVLTKSIVANAFFTCMGTL